MKILVINSGSSSIKYQLINMDNKEVLSAGLVERIGESESYIRHQRFFKDQESRSKEEKLHIKDHRSGLEQVNLLLQDSEVGAITNPDEIEVVGHRVVHGGDMFNAAVNVDDDVKEKIKALIPLAPLHNPANLEGILVAEKVFAKAQQVVVFDTAYHQSMPPHAFRFAIPERFYTEDKLRVYGMHGTSHQYVARQAARYLGNAFSQFNAISIHLGNGCSMTAIKNGKSIDTSMGLSPLPGLMMGTRSGDIDPTVLFYMGTKLQMSFEEIDNVLNKQSGLKGIAGDNDMRHIVERYQNNEADAQLALEMYTYRIKKFIGSYLAILGPLDAIIFTAGVGENSSLVREMACADLEHLGIKVDEKKNNQRSREIQSIAHEDSSIALLVVPTNEELSIAEQAYELANR
ncbi:acetate kinase [Porifericola rhodea]|uniref:acetate kinase n=1 Tax=Porifericola rhodea TaxID=930972 RepID=UPI0026650C46|nr:acetate kinase [Porifericola rhodea]WKN31152.1 acetate kinase [Porifericola rhodea]